MRKYVLTILLYSLIFSCHEKSESYIDFERIDKMINNEIQLNNIPGAVVLIGDEKEILFHKAYGTKNPETKEKYLSLIHI